MSDLTQLLEDALIRNDVTNPVLRQRVRDYRFDSNESGVGSRGQINTLDYFLGMAISEHKFVFAIFLLQNGADFQRLVNSWWMQDSGDDEENERRITQLFRLFERRYPQYTTRSAGLSVTRQYAQPVTRSARLL